MGRTGGFFTLKKIKKIQNKGHDCKKYEKQKNCKILRLNFFRHQTRSSLRQADIEKNKMKARGNEGDRP